LAFLEGDVGRLFSEFALTMAAAVAFSSIVALSLSSMLASKVLQPTTQRTLIARLVERGFAAVERGYRSALAGALRRPSVVAVLFLLVLGSAAWLFREIPSEYAPKEDRGAFFTNHLPPIGVLIAPRIWAFDSDRKGISARISRRHLNHCNGGKTILYLSRGNGLRRWRTLLG
ncbi:MAG: efflux RND transporter permease subunit, partial [Leptolyngbya sp. SIO1D8]|nr:efflux RND transporter permease subunit [Leptolyngbya sp. SIO1D8]